LEGDGRLHQRVGQRRAGAFAEAQAESSSGSAPMAAAACDGRLLAERWQKTQ
jgi:hypothetical protein